MSLKTWFLFLGFLILVIAGAEYRHRQVVTVKDQVITEKDQALAVASSTIAQLSIPQCDNPIATYTAVEKGNATERVYAGKFSVLTPEENKGQIIDGFIFRPFEVGDPITQCVNFVVGKPL